MAIFEFTEISEVAVIGAIGDGATHDMLVVVMRNSAEGNWYLRYRFRYYDAPNKSDPDAPDSKSVWEVKAKPDTENPRKRLVEMALGMIATLKENQFGAIEEIHHVDDGGNPMDALKDSQFFHIREAPFHDTGSRVH